MTKVTLSSQFQKSIQINADIDNLEAIQNYIAITSTLNTLQLFARNLVESKNYSFTITGAYGSGKSITTLVLASILSKDKKIKQKAIELLHLTGDNNDYISKFFLNNNDKWHRLLLVGSKISLRDKIHDQLDKLLTKKQKTQLKDSPNFIFDALDIYTKDTKLFIIVDELGKFLEYSIHDKDIYFLQELAEFVSRSKGNIILLGILHQSFDAYIKNFNKELKDEWQKVQGRFENLLFHPSPLESLNIISKSIIHNEYDTTKYISLVKDVSKYIKSNTLSFNSDTDTIFTQALPLHPLTAIALCALSRKASGQNERSIYNFLNSIEPASFKEFLTQDNDDLYNLYHLFDYLKINQDIFVAKTADGHTWETAKDLSEYCEIANNDNYTKTIKIIAILEIFCAQYRIYATKEIISFCLMKDLSETEQILNELHKHKFLIFRKYNSSYQLFVRSDFNFDEALQTELLKVEFDINILNKFLYTTNTRIVAKRHYIQTGYLRWFKFNLLEEDTAKDYINTLDISNDAIGEFVILLSTSSQKLDLKDKSNVIISYLPKTNEIISLVKNRSALNNILLSQQLEGDKIARQEVELSLIDLDYELNRTINEAIANCEWYYRNNSLGKLNSYEMSSLASKIADDIFNKCFVIKNELINKNKLSSNIVFARKLLMNNIVNNKEVKNLNYTTTPADFCIYDNLINKSGLHYLTQEGAYDISYKNPNVRDNKLFEFFKASENFVESNKEIKLIQLYNFWQQPPFGLKEGVLPLYALIFILSNIDKYAFYDSEYFISDINEQSIEEILVNKDKFTIKNLQSIQAKEVITQNICKAIKDSLSIDIQCAPLPIARALFKFIFKLHDVTKKTNKISNSSRSLRTYTLEAKDPIDYVYNKIPTIFTDIEQSSLSLEASLNELKGFYDTQLLQILEIFFDSFDQKDRNLEKLQQRATIVAKHTVNTKILALNNVLKNNISDHKALAAQLIRLCNEEIEKKWNDSSIDKTIFDLPRLSLEFRQTECLANAKNNKDYRRMFAMTFAANANQDFSLIAQISPNDEKIINQKVNDINLLLKDLNKDLKIAILAELGLSFTKD